MEDIFVMPANRTTFRILVFLFSLIFKILLASDSATPWWKPLYDQGIDYLQNDRLDEAEKQFRDILDRDEKIVQAYYGLGMVYNQKEPGSREAKKQFEKAIEIDPDFGAAYYGVGMVLLNRKDELRNAREYFLKAVTKDSSLAEAWYQLGKTEEELHQIGPAMEAFAELVKLEPENEEYYSAFFETTLLHSNPGKVLEVLKDLKKHFPENPEYDLAIANTYFRLRDYSMCLATLEAIKNKYPDFSRSRIYLLQAKVYFEYDEINEALDYYWSAVNTIKDEKDAKAIFDDVCYIMNDDEYDELQATPIDQVWNFYYRFWRSRDPNLATKKNERLVEHYKRLLYALKHYRRYEPKSAAMRFVYATQHPFYQYNVMGDEFWAQSYWPKALPKNRIIDDLGLIYIRHGEPDLKVTSLHGFSIFEDPDGQPHWEERGDLDLPGTDIPPMIKETSRVPQPTKGERLTGESLRNQIPMNVSWKYYKKGNRPEMIFHFEKHGGTLGWIIEAIPFVIADRHELDPELQQLEQASYSPLISPRARSSETTRVSNIVKAENKRYAKIGLTTETTNYEYIEAPLNFPYQFVSFKAPDGKTLVEVYYMVEGYQTELKKASTGGILDLTKFIGFYDKKWNEYGSINRTDNIKLNISPLEWKGMSIVDVERFTIPPGVYNMEIQIKDNTSNKRGVYKGKYQAVDYHVDHLMLSDIIVSDPIKPKTKESKFSKINIVYNPHMFSAFERGSTVGVYFEIYNLAGDDQMQTHFRVSCTLEPFGALSAGKKVTGFFKNLLGHDKGTIGTSYDYTGKTRDEKMYLNFQLDPSYAGRYKLAIEVVDLNAQTRVTKSVPITIQ